MRAFGVAHDYRGLRDVARRSAFLWGGDRVVRWARAYETGEVPDVDELVDAARAVAA